MDRCISSLLLSIIFVFHVMGSPLHSRQYNGSVKANPTDEEILDSYKAALTATPSLFRYKSVYDKGHFMGSSY